MVHGIRTRDARDLSWFDGMAESHGEEFPRAPTDPLAFAGHLAARAADIRRDPAQLLVSPRDGFTDSDRRIASDPVVGEIPRRTYEEALHGSSYGRLDDDLALLSDWGFGPAAVVRPVLLRHGAASGRRPSSGCDTARLRPGGRRPARAAAARRPGQALPVGHFTWPRTASPRVRPVLRRDTGRLGAPEALSAVPDRLRAPPKRTTS
ncbi:hypothetical protein AB0O75_44945 [Streptomyces sp. NPDC088921]|uniref:hypothetical protein n=1 Tax=unclassified Streptomyces TaxID=2593676 RepID=UPI0034488C78